MVESESQTEQSYPIREVSRITGVNSVTLRAWERRYGLIKPVRTRKGHRLYTISEIEKVKDIVNWLNRGVAISKVKELLAHAQPREALPEPATDLEEWQDQITRFMQAIQDFNEQRADDLFNQTLAVYPLEVVSAKLVLPAVEQLRKSWQGAPFGAKVQELFLENFLRTKIGTRIYHANRAAERGSLLVAGLFEADSEIETLLVAMAASSIGFRIRYVGKGAPLDELVLAVEKTSPKAALFVGNQKTDVARLERGLRGVFNNPALTSFLTGYLLDIHQAELSELELPMLAFVDAINPAILARRLETE